MGVNNKLKRKKSEDMSMKVLVTGGAGFIGSHLVDSLLQKNIEVRVIDNLSSGNRENLVLWEDNSNFEFIQADILEKTSVMKAVSDCEEIYHLAANPEVRATKANCEDHFKQNIQATFQLLEAMRLNDFAKKLVFTSSSTVYGETNVFPTPENYGPTKPISMYGGSKLSCEAIISSYSSMYGFTSIIYRLANVIGPRSNHGVIYDFIQKLRKNPDYLDVLGDGTQSKSYLHINDCVDGILCGAESASGVEIYNIGSNDRISVLEIAQIVKEEMDLPNAEIKLTGGVEGGRGWKGDVKVMQLDISRLRKKGWKSKYSSSEAVRLTARALIKHS
jgi:UDP-glucose 4-epimerase